MWGELGEQVLSDFLYGSPVAGQCNQDYYAPARAFYQPWVFDLLLKQQTEQREWQRIRHERAVDMIDEVSGQVG